MEINSEERNELMQKVIHFLYTIGIEVDFCKIDKECFLPGLYIDQGKLLVDREQLKYPGDILHEAGHIAVVPPADRPTLSNSSILQSKQREAEEMMAIAWSYAAAIHLGIDPHIVFHEDGYKGGGSSIVENFSQGRFFGTPMLQWCGMTIEPRAAVNHGSDYDAYPRMLKWIRES